jgi:two-component system, chemotaxis family, protein-glutamate methylesterase/glutaminase
MAKRDIVVVGASAGGTEALTELVRALPAEFPAAIFVVVHFPASASSVLPRILSRAGSLPATHPEDGDTFATGRIYVARPDCHLMLRDGRLSVRRGPKENNSRPAIDPLFRSAARSAGKRVVGVVLSGNLDDGTAGLLSIKQHGGIAVIQAPETAQYPGMPRSAIDHVPVDYVVPIEQMAGLLVRLTSDQAGPKELVPMDSDDSPSDEETLADRQTQPGAPSTMTCPECHGSLWETREGALVHFRCRWATRIPRRASWLTRPTSWRPRSGRPSARLKSTRRSAVGWHHGPPTGGTRTAPRPSLSRRWTPSTTHPPSATCCRRV